MKPPCTFCGTETRRICHGCGTGICNQCGFLWHRNMAGKDYRGGYKPLVCQECNELAKPYVEQSQKISKEAQCKINTEEANWKAECELLSNP